MAVEQKIYKSKIKIKTVFEFELSKINDNELEL